MILSDWLLNIWKDAEEPIEYAVGNVFGHPKLSDGSRARTSKIVKTYSLGDGSFVFETKSGHLYEAKKSDMDVARVARTEQILGKYEIFDGKEIEESVRIENKEALKAYESYKNKDEQLKRIALDNMDEDGLYLFIQDLWAPKAFFKKDGIIRELEAGVHTGMFQDSVLVIDSLHKKVDFRYFPKTDMEPYHWSDGLENVYIHNLDDRSFGFLGTHRKIECKPGEATKIFHSEYTGEGLFSPDMVNGKSLIKGMPEVAKSEGNEEVQ